MKFQKLTLSIVPAIFGFILIANQASAQEKLDTLIWGVDNRGSAQQIDIDHFTSGNTFGVVYEDVRVPAPVANARKVIVGVLDTGIDYTHPQLKNVIVGKGYNAINNTNDASDGHGHGTHVSGIIAGELDGSGFHGVSPNARILPVKVVQTGPNAPIRPQDTSAGAGSALTENVAKGLTWAINHGAEVINLSLAWPSTLRSKAVDEAMTLAAEKNVIIVSSAGNDSTTANVYPCIYENVICVGATGPDGAFTHFSNYGPMVDVLAPGISILSTWPQSKLPTTFSGQIGYEFRNGTSMSAPFVTGAIAELLARGFSPDEAKARLLLSTRARNEVNLFSTEIVGKYTHNTSTETKSSRYGNIDITAALSVNPSPLIAIRHKGVFEIEWNGTDDSITLPIEWKNNWKDTTGNTTIRINDQSFSVASLKSQATFMTSVTVHLGANPESSMKLMASVSTPGFSKANIEIPLQIVRAITLSHLPETAIVKTISGISADDYSGVRSIVNKDRSAPRSFIYTRMVDQAIEIAVVKNDSFFGSVTIAHYTEDQLLNFYQLPDASYAAIFTKQVANVPRPNFYIERFTKDLKFISETTLATDTTVLSENFTWVPYKNIYTLLWISIGFTPKPDLAPYDPYHPDYQDPKTQRVFFLAGDVLRTVKLGKNQLPIQILPDGKLLVAEGTSYLQIYRILTLKDGIIDQSDDLSLKEYRMLVGLDSTLPATQLSGENSNTVVDIGSSTAGNLRATSINSDQKNVAPFDQVLSRSTVLDALVSVFATYQDATHQYYFVQTHYDLQFFTSGSNETLSTTLNRYSYVPSLIFAKSFYPTVVRNGSGAGLPGIYIPANTSNGETSEVIVADIANGKLRRPAKLKIRLKAVEENASCAILGNLIEPTRTETAKQAYICGTRLVEIPLTLEN